MQFPLHRYFEDDNKWITRYATEEEIHQAVNQISPLKTLGSECMHAIFCKKCWHIIGKDICFMIITY